MSRTLVLGGARSGKSAYAEQLALATNLPLVYIATAQARDAEMQARIAHHQQRRATDWLLVEEPLALAEALLIWCTPGRVVLLDCLTLWLSNILFPEFDQEADQHADVAVIGLPDCFHTRRRQFLSALDTLPGELIIVSNEVGLGVIPYGAVSRCFVDEAGRLNQHVAQRCERVVLVTAGLPLDLKNTLSGPR